MFNKTAQRILKALHIVLIALWVGGIVSLMALQALASTVHDGEQLAVLLRSLFFIHEYIIMNTSLAVILTGLLFSLFTDWGFFKFRWITVKWLSVVLLVVMTVFFFGPAVNGMAALSDILRAGAFGDRDFLHYSRTFIVLSRLQLAVLLALVLLSVLKPWGQRTWQPELDRKKLVIAAGFITVATIVSLAMSSAQLNRYRNMPITNLDLTRASDGAFTGQAECGVPYAVTVVVKKHKIRDIVVLKNPEGEYARLGEEVLKRITKAQKLDVDAITGATTSSKCLMKAVENAVAKGMKP